MAVVGVPDERLDRVAATVGARPVVHETIQFHDIAGLVRGAHQGEGLGNQFLANIRETDAILHVVRCTRTRRWSTRRGASTRSRTSRRSRPSCCSRTSSRPSGGSSGWQQARSLDKLAVAEERWLREVVEALREAARCGRCRSRRMLPAQGHGSPR